MSRIQNFLKTVAVAVLLLLTLTAGAWAGELPGDLVKLLPADPDLVLVVSSLDDLEDAWGEMQAMVQDFSDDPEDALPDFQEVLQGMEMPLADILAWNQPLAVSVSLANLMAGQEPRFALVAPLKNQDHDIKALAEAMQMPTVEYAGDYVLVSQASEFLPAATATPLLSHLPGRTVALSANLQTLWAQFSPMLDFALMSMNAQQPSAGEGSDTTGGPAEPEMSPEDMAALGDIFRAVMESADTMTLGLDLENQTLGFGESFVALPGSVLEPVAQPDFNEALQLTRLLDEKADWIGAYAVDVNEMVDLYKDFYLFSLQQDLGAIEDQLGAPLAEILKPYFDSIKDSMLPSAFSMDMDQDRIDMQYAVATPDAKALVRKQAETHEKMAEVFPFLKSTAIKKKEKDGLEISGWDFQWDPEGLKTFAGADPAMAADQNMDQVLTAIGEMYQRYLPGVRLGTTDSHLFMSLGRDSDSLRDMAKKARKNKGKVSQRLARAAKAAGPGCQGVFQGDLASLMSMIVQIAGEYSDQEMPRMDLEPMPLSYAVRITDRTYAVDYSLGMKGLPRLLAFLEELEDD